VGLGVQEGEENEGGELYSDGLGRHVAQGSGRERSSVQPDQLLLVSTQGSSGRRALERRITSSKEPMRAIH